MNDEELLKAWDARTAENPFLITRDNVDRLTYLIRKRNAEPPKRNFYVQSDYVPGGAIKSMADGKMYDSKSQYYRSVKEAGLVIVGNDKIETKPQVNEVSGRDIKDAIERIKSR